MTDELAARDANLVIGLGELLWDEFPDQRRPGGAPANVAFHASQLGRRGVVLSRVGIDQDGDALLTYLATRGLDSSIVQRDPTHRTGYVTVHLEGVGPAYTIHPNVAWDFLEATEAWLALCRSAGAICYGTLAQRGGRSRAAIQECLAAGTGAWRIYDVNVRPPFVDRAWVDQSLRKANVMKLNQDELPRIAELLDLGPQTLESFGPALRSRYAELRVVCVTRGAEGSHLESADETLDLPATPCDVVDTVGAGDAFTAALAHGLLADWPLEATGRLASDLAAAVAARGGAMPRLRAECEQMLARHDPRR